MTLCHDSNPFKKRLLRNAKWRSNICVVDGLFLDYRMWLFRMIMIPSTRCSQFIFRVFDNGMIWRYRATNHLKELLAADNMRNILTVRIDFQSFKIESVFRHSVLCFFLALILLLFSVYLCPKIVFLLFYRIISSFV